MSARIAIAVVTGLLMAQAHVWPARSEQPKKIGVLLAAGDISWCPGKGATYADEVAQIIGKVVQDEAPLPVRVLALGDLAYQKGTERELKCFAERWKGFDEILLPVPGNHDYDNCRTDGGDYFAHFRNNPFVHQNDEKDPDKRKKDPRWDKKGFFVLDFPRQDGPWRLIGLNDNFRCSKFKKDMAAQLSWLETKLNIDHDGNGQRCVLAFWHVPLLSSGQHGHKDYKDPRPEAALTKKRLMQTAVRMLHRHGASVLLTAHDHNYEQFKPHDHDGNPADDGIRSFVVGTGGAGLTKDFYTNWEVASEEGPFGIQKGNHGVLKLDLYEDHYAWDFLQIERHGDKPIPKKVIPLGPARANCNARKRAAP